MDTATAGAECTSKSELDKARIREELRKVIFIIESEDMTYVPDGPRTERDDVNLVRIDFSEISSKIGSDSYSSLNEFVDDFKRIIFGYLDRYKVFEPKTNSQRQKVLRILKFGLDVACSARMKLESSSMMPNVDDSGEHEERYALAKKLSDGIPYFTPSFAYRPPKLPSMSSNDIGTITIFPCMNTLHLDPPSMLSLYPGPRDYNRKRKCPSREFIRTAKVLKRDYLSTFLPAFSTAESTLSYEDSLDCIASLKFDEALRDSRIPPFFLGVDTASFGDLAKQFSLDCDDPRLDCLEALAPNIALPPDGSASKLADKILFENARLILLAEKFQNNRFSLNNHAISDAERRLVFSLLRRLKAVVSIIPPKFLISVDSTRRAIQDLRPLDSFYRGTIVTPDVNLREPHSQPVTPSPNKPCPPRAWS